MQPATLAIPNTLKKETKIALPTQYEIRYVLPNEIIRCEADDNYVNIVLLTGEKLLIAKSLKDYENLLKPHGFIRTHQSHFVSISFMQKWLRADGGVLMLQNGDKIPVSKSNREKVKSSIVA